MLVVLSPEKNKTIVVSLKMHKNLVCIVILVGLMLTGVTAMAQKDTTNDELDDYLITQKDTTHINDSTDYSSFDIYYGYRSYFQNFYNQLNTTKNTQFNKPVQTIGIGYSGYFAVNRESTFYGRFIYSQVIPQSIIVNNNINCKITGFVFNAAFGKELETKKFAVYFYAGFNTGRLRMYGNELVRQKNAFFSPKIGLQPKIKLGHIIVSLIIEYEYDITNPNWRRTYFSNNNKINLSSFRQTGITALLSIGYGF
ncbi:MAG: hypothetical protein ACHQII_02605 [Bacteroidia bacterium]